MREKSLNTNQTRQTARFQYLWPGIKKYGRHAERPSITKIFLWKIYLWSTSDDLYGTKTLFDVWPRVDWIRKVTFPRDVFITVLKTRGKRHCLFRRYFRNSCVFPSIFGIFDIRSLVFGWRHFYSLSSLSWKGRKLCIYIFF